MSVKNVAILIEQFLPSIQTFIYEELTAINKFNMFVLTEERLSEDIYPFENVHICKKIKEYSKIIKKQNIKLIHTKFGQNALRYLELKKLTGVPFIASFHGVDASHQLKSGSMLSMYKKKLFPKVDHIIAVSPTLKDNLVKAGCPKNKITVIWSGVDVEKFY
jgi:glycosyltransferase involved in cell wall biosynthesis